VQGVYPTHIDSNQCGTCISSRAGALGDRTYAEICRHWSSIFRTRTKSCRGRLTRLPAMQVDITLEGQALRGGFVPIRGITTAEPNIKQEFRNARRHRQAHDASTARAGTHRFNITFAKQKQCDTRRPAQRPAPTRSLCSRQPYHAMHPPHKRTHIDASLPTASTSNPLRAGRRSGRPLRGACVLNSLINRRNQRRNAMHPPRKRTHIDATLPTATT